MLRLVAAFSRVFVVSVGVGLLSLQGSVCAQISAHRDLDADPGVVRGAGAIDEAPVPEVAGTVIVGHVIGSDGTPAAGAVVVSSAGGQAVTDAEGAFSLTVEVPAGSDSVRVTAVLSSGTGSLAGSSQVSGLAPSVTTSAGTLILEQSAGCQPSWLPTFQPSSGTDAAIRALAVFDDGSGPSLFVGGTFAVAGGQVANSIAKWDGAKWSALGSGMSGFLPYVNALAVFDDGSGPALVAGGGFTSVDGVAANYIAKWNGHAWSALGSGMSGPLFNTYVNALTVFDDGSGPALYAGGSFTTAGGVAANNMAKWNGTSWFALGSGTNGPVSALTVFDDAGGPALYAGGGFFTAGGVPANNIAKWNGSIWSALGSGTNSTVSALAAVDDGSGPALYVGGNFTTAGGVAANRIAKWNGTTWSALGSGMAGPSVVDALTAFDDGSGLALYAGGTFTFAGGVAANRIAKWNGTIWSALGSGMSSVSGSPGVLALTVFDDGSDPAIYAGGDFLSAGGPAENIAKWDGASWSTLGDALNDSVDALTVFDDGSRPALYAGGQFTDAGGLTVNNIAKWNGMGWSALGSGMNSSVNALTVFDDGSGPALYAGGQFTDAGGLTVNNIAMWNGMGWSALGSGMNDPVNALTVFDDGSGPALYAGGYFTTAGGVGANNIAKWNGTTWSALGSGMGGFGVLAVFALTVFDDGSGPALYAGGAFIDAGGVSAGRIAKWTGTSWSALGSGMNDWVFALTVFDDGSGPALYAGGDFTFAGGVVANHIAKWDGSAWSALGSGLGSPVTSSRVDALTVYDDGSGSALYAGGGFSAAGGVAAKGIAKWNATSWSALGSGIFDPAVNALTVFDDGNGPALWAGLDGLAIDSGDHYLAKWGGCSLPPSPWTNLGSGLAGISGIPQLNGTGDLLAGTPGSLSLADAAPSAPAALFISASNTPTPFKGGTLLTVPVLLTLTLLTDSQGDILLPWTAFPSGLSGVSLYFQCGIQDAAAVKGVALSNALGADVP